MKRQRARGQALVEFLMVAAAVLLPLFLIVPLIGQFQDVQHAADMAARYVGFDARSNSDRPQNWAPIDRMNDEVRVRFFGDPNAGISSTITQVELNYNRWITPLNLLGNLRNSVQVASDSPGTGTTPAMALLDDPSAALNNGAQLRPAAVGLNTFGTLQATVVVNLNPLPNWAGFFRGTGPYSDMAGQTFSLRSRSAMYAGDWSSNSTVLGERIGTQGVDLGDWAYAPRRFADGVPGTTFNTAQISTVVSQVEAAGNPPAAVGAAPPVPAVPARQGPKIGDLEIWRDTVPQDRLAP